MTERPLTAAQIARHAEKRVRQAEGDVAQLRAVVQAHRDVVVGAGAFALFALVWCGALTLWIALR